MRKVFILNNNTKDKVKYALMKNIKENLAGEDIIIEKTKASGHATYIAKKYALQEEPTHIFICGGDGTVHEVVNGLVGANHIKVSILPIGTGNDFIKSFDGLTKEDFLNLGNYKETEAMDIDLMKVNGEYAINTISIGFDVKVAEEVNHMSNQFKLTGIGAYYMGMLKTLIQLKCEKYDFQIDEEAQEGYYTIIALCNGRYYGGGYNPCPQAQLNDGIIDMCCISDVTRRGVLKLAKVYEKGEHGNYPNLATFFQGKTIHFNTKNKAVSVCLDGEIRQIKNPTIEIEQNVIHLLLPKK
ncbi:MAG: YegS/Rv2252/BmrU family lipid kinase [Firmicutes bacterium]|nr:YegS/Rv2252/BmrU family lipid kinase [Bacillota bacterium]